MCIIIETFNKDVLCDIKILYNNILGAAVIFAQFHTVNQFRSIAWYNVAAGVVLIALQVVMFQGESSCRAKRKNFANSCNKRPKLNTSILEIFISFQTIKYTKYYNIM